MFKKITFITIALFTCLYANAQQFTSKDLVGRWQTHHNGSVGDLLFITDSTAAFVTPDGFVCSNITYTIQVKKDIIKFKFTADIHRKKNPNHYHAEIKFLNDSVFLIVYNWFMPSHPDTTSKKLSVYKKVKEIPGAALRYPTYKDLLGEWTHYFKGKPLEKHINFRSERLAEFIQDTTAADVVYTADFTKQPIPVDFYSSNTQKTMQAFLMFMGKDALRIEFFPRNNRGDHFTILGDNTTFLREKPGVANSPVK